MSARPPQPYGKTPVGKPPMKRNPTIRANRIVKFSSTAGKHDPILRGCSLEIRGGLTAVVGPSGAGKTSLLYCLSGLDRPDQGQVSFDGTDLYALSDEKRTQFLRRTASFVFQEYNLIGYLTVEENVRLPQTLAKQHIDSTAVENVLSRFGLLAKRSAKVSTLSGGEQQRAALCRAILTRPSVIFADEPTGALDTILTGIVLQTLRTIAIQDCSVVMVTHDVECASLADHIVFMRDGVISQITERLGVDQILHTMTRLGGDRDV